MHTIQPDNRKPLAALFTGHPYLRLVIAAILEGHMGTAVADDTTHPHVAKLELGFIFLGGDASHPAAVPLVQCLQGTVVVPNDAWRDLLYHLHGKCVKRQERFDCDSRNLNLAHLKQLSNQRPSGFNIQPLDLALARQIRKDVTPDLIDNFSSPEAFITQGFGFCALKEGHIACGATTFAVCAQGIEIEIDTHPHYQQMGLATAVGAALIHYCLQNNIEPHWDADNAVSAKLAEKFGYQITSRYHTYRIRKHI